MTDRRGNTIDYGYGRSAQTLAAPCLNIRGTVDEDSWPASVTWGGNPGLGAGDRYRVEFVAPTRPYDGQAERAAGQIGPAPRQTRYLTAIRVLSNPSGAAWELVRGWNLGYVENPQAEPAIYTDSSIDNGDGTYRRDEGFPKLTLKSVQRVGNDGATALPATTFAYGTDGGTGFFANGGWNRLVGVDNGQGGTLGFGYEQIGPTVNNGRTNQTIFRNRQRVTRKTQDDGRGQRADWTYVYTNPALNTLGWRLYDADGAPDPNQTQEYPNSAVLYLNKRWDGREDTQWQLVTPQFREFRGHASVKETAPDGGATETWFHQGDAGCTPTAGGGGTAVYDADPCFVQIRDREFLRGRAYRTRRLGAGGQVSEETAHRFGVAFGDYSGNPLAGNWRAWTREDERTLAVFEGGATAAASTTTKTVYDPAAQGGAQRGNWTAREEYEGAALLRRVERAYAARDDGASYLVDRVTAEVVRDGAGAALARADWFYDGQPAGQVGARGELTLERKYADAATPGAPSDTRHGYDGWGNRTATTTYDAAGAGRTTSTVYDGAFRVFPVQVTNPLGHIERADYDSRMGTLTGVTDANGQTTTAGYDGFGRLTTIVKPGDSAQYPTIRATYYDGERPFRYTVLAREVAGTEAARPTTRLYDGLGRAIQVKRESRDGAQNIVADTRYDGQGRAVRQSQPRYVDETPATTFWGHTPVADDAAMRWTTTAYDTLGRPTAVTAPDGAVARTTYAADGAGRVASATDANGHRTDRATDLFGRLRAVTEYSGNGGGEGGYAVYATTTYGYDARDLLTRVVDAGGNVTTIGYDGLGRKTAMRDPDMGAWAYAYDPNGNLTGQTDAKGQTIAFAYDALDRLTGKAYSSGEAAAQYRYDEAGAPHGIGRRTSMSNGAAATRYQYDARGRPVREEQAVAGVTGGAVVQRAHDSADRVTSLTYPSGEVVSYTYDAAWRQTSVCSALAGTPCYARDATYSALDQPRGRTLGNGLAESRSYDSPMARLARLLVGPAGAPGGVFDQAYTYDPVGNVATRTDQVAGQGETFGYDHRDRLARAATAGGPAGTAYDEAYSYDPVGNLLQKGAAAYTYPAGGAPSVRPHAPTAVGGQAYTYDANGNLTAGGGRAYTWDAENRPTEIATGGAPAVGQVRAWGHNGYGELGDGTTTSRAAPVRVGGLGDVVALASASHTLALRRDGTVWAWGRNDVGQLGDGTTQQRTTPARVAGLGGVVAVAAGIYHSLALTGDGTVWAWGYNGNGGLGRGGADLAPHPTAAAVAGLTGVVALAAGFEHSLALVGEGGGSVTERYGYDADGGRVRREHAGGTTLYAGGGLWEETLGGSRRSLYTLQGQPVAQRDSATNAVGYLHGDHLGSVSAVSDQAGAAVGRRAYDPWGAPRGGEGIGEGQTSLDYTGQRKDGTGLLFYHMRSRALLRPGAVACLAGGGGLSALIWFIAGVFGRGRFARGVEEEQHQRRRGQTTHRQYAEQHPIHSSPALRSALTACLHDRPGTAGRAAGQYTPCVVRGLRPPSPDARRCPPGKPATRPRGPLPAGGRACRMPRTGR